MNRPAYTTPAGMVGGMLGLAIMAFLVALVPGAAQVSGTLPDVDQLLQQFDQLYESGGTIAQMEITIVKPKKTRTMRLRSWGKGRDHGLFVVEVPVRDAGTATLKVDNNLWNYLPKIARTIRVPPSMMMGSWMGTDLTNDDLVRESSYKEDYLAGEVSPCVDPPGWLVRLEARPGLVGLWNRLEIVFSADQGLPVQVQYYDRKGRLARTMRLEEVKSISGRLVPTRLTIIPEREEGQHTTLHYLHIEFDVELDDSMFSLAQLERRR